MSNTSANTPVNDRSSAEAQTPLVVVIARAGSKGLPNKAMAILDDRPLVAWSLEHALASKLKAGVIVSSDSPEVRAVGQSLDVDVTDRPAELASDQATIDAAVRHAVEVWEAKHKKTCDQVVILYGNIPLRPWDLVDRALNKLSQSQCDSVQSVYPVGKNHPYWMKRLTNGTDSTNSKDNADSANDVLAMYQDNAVYRRQDLPPVYMLDGGIIALTRTSLFNFDATGKEPHQFLGKDRRAVVTEAGDVVDVDTPLDLLLAQTIHAFRKKDQPTRE